MIAPVRSSVERAPEDVDNPAVAVVYAHWREKAGDRWAPAWRDMDIMALPGPLIPYVVVCDVADGGEFIYRYWGRGHTEYHGVDFSYKPLSSMSREWVRKLLLDQYQHVLEARKPLVFETQYTGMERPLYSIRLPLSDDGENVTGIFGVAERRGVSEDLAKWLVENKEATR
ncbi:MAG: hypothetical protein JJ900_14075 [Rhodospirillales bacterium]|nr:hypothetical protein [Rhodospirillales bacterium]MBO6787971.1 hypothetical protein [Rhodospirillales bacterium]